MTTPLSHRDRDELAKLLGLVRNPGLSKEHGWWLCVDLYDDDFEQVVGHQYLSWDEQLAAIASHQSKAIAEARMQGRIEEVSKLEGKIIKYHNELLALEAEGVNHG